MDVRSSKRCPPLSSVGEKCVRPSVGVWVGRKGERAEERRFVKGGYPLLGETL